MSGETNGTGLSDRVEHLDESIEAYGDVLIARELRRPPAILAAILADSDPLRAQRIPRLFQEVAMQGGAYLVAEFEAVQAEACRLGDPSVLRSLDRVRDALLHTARYNAQALLRSLPVRTDGSAAQEAAELETIRQDVEAFLEATVRLRLRDQQDQVVGEPQSVSTSPSSESDQAPLSPSGEPIDMQAALPLADAVDRLANLADLFNEILAAWDLGERLDPSASPFVLHGRIAEGECHALYSELLREGGILAIEEFHAVARQVACGSQEPLAQTLEGIRESLVQGASLALPGIARRLASNQPLDAGSDGDEEAHRWLVEMLLEYLHELTDLCQEGDTRVEDLGGVSRQLRLLRDQDSLGGDGYASSDR